MGNILSRCAQNVRHALRTCAKKHPEDEAMLSACDSESPEKCQEPMYDPALTGTLSRTGSRSSLMRLQDKMEPVNCKIVSTTPRPHPKLSPAHRARLGNDGHRGSTVSDTEEHHVFGHSRTLVDKECQTYSEDLSPATILSKEYIVRTYSIQNATPSPATQAKFSSGPEGNQTQKGSTSAASTPIANLEKHQDDVLKRLEQLQCSVSKLAGKYKVTETLEPVIQVKVSEPSQRASVASTTLAPPARVGAVCQPMLKSGSVLDLVINVDPSSIPLSLIILCERLSSQYTVLKTTYSHSSVTGTVPEKLQNLLASNGNKRSESQIVIHFVWKKVAYGPELIVDPTRQTAIQGEVNVARYLARLLNPSWEQADIVRATQQDELLDLAQLQILEGNSKEKSAAVRTLNSLLGKKNWLDGEEPSTADICCWSALQQSGQSTSPPANVKKWLASCSQHKFFENALSLLS
ncbi:Aminoacyl tRNA synthase complex-interacting multifunctional protein 2 [Bulinus truncatus]|nr:Aminoacyl tRNA synthase complex-interacting multifunctional protein 2 [Bulinus truncatus]